MNAADSLGIVTSTIASLQSNFTAILPVLLPVVITVAVLFFAWRKVHGLAKGRG
jgi:mannose/fructose/N-acetylgalactosamine-specific phosphotransferase system component IID